MTQIQIVNEKVEIIASGAEPPEIVIQAPAQPEIIVEGVGPAGPIGPIGATGAGGDGSTKYLNSNRPGNSDPQNNAHLAVQVTAIASGNPGAAPYYISSGVAGAGAKGLFRSTGGTCASALATRTSAARRPSFSGFVPSAA